MLVFGNADTHLVAALRKWGSPQALLIYDQDSDQKIQFLKRELPLLKSIELKRKMGPREEARLFQAISLLPRDSVLISAGSEKTGSYVGFLSATYLGGIKWIHIPCTLSSGLNLKNELLRLKFHNMPLQLPARPQFIFVEPQKVAKRRRLSRVAEEGHLFHFLLSKQGGKVAKHKTLSPGLARRWMRPLLEGRPDPLGRHFAEIFQEITAYRCWEFGESIWLGVEMTIRLSRIRGHIKGNKASLLLQRVHGRALKRPQQPLDHRLFFKSFTAQNEGFQIPLISEKGVLKSAPVTRAEVLLALIETCQVRKWKLI